ncbi:hypothetical protein GIB67_001741 [Kingdonia uniflora]|uniref:Uncharacterized protein n=1 Tax=Kingdonia uniflora TaxID=39325 RepID=A0A7J7LJM9_9MAGN|nr:hypothetical protein GIB67_001741 [Kingdonia uniflora]
MAEAIVSMALDGLGSFLRQEIEKEVTMVAGVQEEIEKLTKTLTSIQAVHHDADRKRVQDERVKVWLENLKEVVYEIKDVLDKWNTKIKKYSKDLEWASIISILGKTTLVQLILHDNNIVKHFEKTMWVCVSEPFDRTTIAKVIIEATGTKVPENIEWDTLNCSCLS